MRRSGPAGPGQGWEDRSTTSTTQAEPLDQRAVAVDVGLGHVVQQSATLTDEEHQATTTVVVVLVLLQVLGQVCDAPGEDRDLDLGRTRVTLAGGELFDGLLLDGSVKRHVLSSRFPVARRPPGSRSGFTRREGELLVVRGRSDGTGQLTSA